ncbi:MAG: metal ABC transporter ATP-binding protein [Nocardioides sp.]
MLNPPSSPVVAEIRDGVYAIDGRPILRQINLRLHSGEFVALLGANGSGKSTLVRALTGLRTLTSGTAHLFGTPVARFAEWKRIGFVPQRSGAAGGVPASVWEVVASGRLSRRRLLRPMSARDRSAIASALATVGLSGRERDGITTLSGGEQQRVLIARALAGEPDLYFLDEPMAGVDLLVQQSLSDTLGMLKQDGRTIVLVAHELGGLAPLIDRAVVMRDGRIVHDGALPDGSDDSAWLMYPAHHHEHPHEDHVPHVGGLLESMSDRPNHP